MPSLFASLAAVAGATVDAVFSEGFTLEPVAAPARTDGYPDVNARPIPSVRRPPLPFIGTWVAAGALLHAHGRTMADATTVAIAAEKPMIDVAVSALPELPQVGDIVRRLDTGETFTVTHYLPADLGRAWIALAETRARGLPR